MYLGLTLRLKLKYDEPLSNVAFDFYLRPYTKKKARYNLPKVHGPAKGPKGDHKSRRTSERDK